MSMLLLVPVASELKVTEPRDSRVPFMMSKKELDAVDEWRFANRIPTRADALRRLCQIGLALDAESEKLASTVEKIQISANALTEETIGENRNVSVVRIMDEVLLMQEATLDALLQLENVLESHGVLKAGGSLDEAVAAVSRNIETGEAERVRRLNAAEIVRTGIIDAVEEDAVMDVFAKDKTPTIYLEPDKDSRD